MSTNPFVGTWRLISAETKTASGVGATLLRGVRPFAFWRLRQPASNSAESH